MALPLRNRHSRRSRKSSRVHIVVPSADVSAESLLRALLAIVYQVLCCDRPRRFLRKNCLLLARKIKILSLLFEDVRDSKSPPSPSALLCFRELYVVLQKAKNLLEDCSCKVSSVWLVMQTEEFSQRFQDITDEMGCALKVLPLPLLDVPVEVREHVELVRDQTSRRKVSVNAAQYCRLRTSVLTVLEEFEKEVKPDESLLRQIFQELQLQNARDCQEEIDLLEEEMKVRNQMGEKQNISTINSLIGFMRYCKCVFFGVTEMESNAAYLQNAEADAPGGRPDLEDAPVIPDDFRCPISLDLMREPVIVSSGQTYELASITRWLEEGHRTCPKTGQTLVNTLVIPNYALRNLIIQYCEELDLPFDEPERGRKKSVLGCIATTKAAMEAAKMTAAFLVEKLSTGSFEIKKQVIYELRLLAKCSVDNRACIAEAGAIPVLVPFLASDDPKVQENAVTTLLNLSIHEKNKSRLIQPEVLQPIIEVVKDGLSMEAKENAAATLYSLSCTDEYRQLIGDRPGSITALVDLFRQGTVRGKRDAATALFNLSVFHANDVVAAGLVPLLVSVLARYDPSLWDEAAAVMAVLVRQPQGLIAVMEASAIPRLVSLITCTSSSPKCKENSVGILLSLSCACNGGKETVDSLALHASLIPALYNLLTSGSARAKRKASSLLRILHSWQPPHRLLQRL